MSNNQNTKKQEALRFSIRIAGTVTSLSLRRNIVSLWLTLNLDSISEINLSAKIMDFIYSCLSDWKSNTGKGYSDFVSEKMIQDILEKEDFLRYKEISSRL